MGLRAKLTQLSLVGKTFLSDTIPVRKTKTAFFIDDLLWVPPPDSLFCLFIAFLAPVIVLHIARF